MMYLTLPVNAFDYSMQTCLQIARREGVILENSGLVVT